MPKVIIMTDPNGKNHISVEGARGSSCELITKDILAKLGQVESNEKTTDYYNNQGAVSNTIKQSS